MPLRYNCRQRSRDIPWMPNIYARWNAVGVEGGVSCDLEEELPESAVTSDSTAHLQHRTMMCISAKANNSYCLLKK